MRNGFVRKNLNKVFENTNYTNYNESRKKMMDMQPEDVEYTWANIDLLIKDYDYKPNTSMKIGVRDFVEWYKMFYNKNKITVT